jgi:hypothetical protein
MGVIGTGHGSQSRGRKGHSLVANIFWLSRERGNNDHCFAKRGAVISPSKGKVLVEETVCLVLSLRAWAGSLLLLRRWVSNLSRQPHCWVFFSLLVIAIFTNFWCPDVTHRLPSFSGKTRFSFLLRGLNLPKGIDYFFSIFFFPGIWWR